MDIRGTLQVNENFSKTIQECFEKNEKVSMIVDDGGLLRIEGFIKNIHLDHERPYLILKDESKINLHTIVALNGTFLSDYSEC